MIRDGRVEHEVFYPHPPARVWRALVNRDELGMWLMPSDFIAERGRTFTFDASPELGFITGEVLEVDAPRLLRCRWSGTFGDTVVTFRLTSSTDGTGTTVNLEHAAWADAHHKERDGFDQGWHDKLFKDLPALLAGSQ